MKYKIILIAIIFSQILVSAQEIVTTTVENGIENPELQEIFDFQNISINKFKFQGKSIDGKFYKVYIKEFKNGKLISSNILFDGTEAEIFKIKSSRLNYKIFTKISDKSIIFQLRSRNFSSAKKEYELMENIASYVTRNFMNNSLSIENSLNNEFALLAIITPTLNKDRSGSYCKVVQSDVAPEEIGSKFNIPHYFLVTMKFINVR